MFRPSFTGALGALAVVCAAGATSSAAFAQSAESAASISAFRYELIDLNPNDNITPSVQFSDRFWQAFAGYHVYPADSDYNWTDSPGSIGIGTAFGAGSAAVDSSGVSASVGYALTRPDNLLFNSEAYTGANFILSAASGIVFSALGAIDASHLDGTHGFASIIMRAGLEGEVGPLYERSEFAEVYRTYEGSRN